MKIKYSAHIQEDSGLNELVSNHGLSKYLKDNDYGNNEVEIFFVINCFGENTKNRIRFDSKEKVLYWDVILSYREVKKLTINEKKVLLANAIIDSFDVLYKYKKLHIDKNSIKADIKEYYIKEGWLQQ